MSDILAKIAEDEDRIADQPPPIQDNETTPIWELVIRDMQERDHVGRQRYGTPLQAHNGRDMLVDAYQEALDMCVYLRGAIEERIHNASMEPQVRGEGPQTPTEVQR